MTDIATLSIAVDSSPVKGADTAMQGLGKTGQWLEGVIGKAMAAFVSYKIVEFIKDSATLAARYETLGVVMGVVGNNAGYTSQQMENYAKALQETGISMVESRNTLAIMAQAHIDLAKATELGREAQDAAVIGNINSSEAFQRMIYGIQSGQTDVLRTIGINVNFEASYAKLAAQLGKTTKDLTENEKATARMNAVLERGPGLAGAYEASMGTAGKQMLSMKRYADDLQVVLGDMFGGALQVGVEAVNNGLKGMKDWLEKNKEAAAGARENLRGTAEEFVGLVQDALEVAGQARGITEEFTFMEIAAGGARLVMSLIRDISNSVLGIIEMIVGNIETVVLLLPKLGSELAKMAGIKLPKWMNPDTYWNSARDLANNGADRFGIKALKRFYMGNGESIDSSLPLDIGYKRETGSVNTILEQQRIWEAQRQRTPKPGSGGHKGKASGSTNITGDYSDVYAGLYSDSSKLSEDLDRLYQEKVDYQLAIEQNLLEQSRKDAEEMKRIHTDLFGDMGVTLECWANQASDAFTDFCFTGKASFNDLITSMLLDLARLAMQQNVTTPISGWLSSAVSSLFSSGITGDYSDVYSGAYSGLASGGPVSSGTPYIVGEVGPEVFVPSQSGSIVPNNKLGSTTNQTTITVNVSSDGKTDAKTQAKGAASLGRDLEAAVVQILQKHQRVGGALA